MRKSFFLVGLIFFAACSSVVPKDPETLIWHFGAEPDTLNPITSTDAYASRIDSLIYDSLIERNNQTLELEPKMAERWEISPDGREITFYLRSGIRWQDGQPVTTDDILYSYETIMDPKVDSAHLKVYFQDIQKVEKVGEQGIRFIYKTPYFMALEQCGGLPIIPKHIFQEKDPHSHETFNTHPQNIAPLGNGPYKFVCWDTGKRIVVERNENYWGKAIGKMPSIKRMSFEVVSEDAVVFQILKKGELDYAGLRPIQWVRQTDSAEFKKKFEKYQFYSPGYSFIGWNMRRPYFADKRVRRAMTMLVNRAQILEKLNFGLGRIVTGPFYLDSKDYNKNIKVIPYAPEDAKKLLAEAGWADHDGDKILDKDGVKFKFEFLIPSGRRFAERLANLLKEDLKGLGIDMEIRQIEWAVFVKQLNERKFDAVTLSWVFGFEQDPYQVWHSSQADQGSNFVGFKNAEVDRLIAEGRMTFDREKRAELFQKLHAIIDDEQPYTFLYNNPSLVALSRRFENVNVYPGGMDPIEWRVKSEVIEP